MSVHTMSENSFKVCWRSPDHTRRCRPGCVKAMHQHSRTFDTRHEAKRFDDKMIMVVAGAREIGHTVGILPERPGSVRTFRSIALDTIADKKDRGKWSAGTARGMGTALAKLGNWAGQPITSASVDLRGAQAIVSGVKYPDRVISLLKATCDHAVRSGDVSAHSMSALEADRSRMPDARREFILATPEQLATVCAGLDAWRPGLGLALALMRSCGLRTGEALGVEVGDFDSDFATLRVSRQIDCDGAVTTLKGKRSDSFRIVPVPVSLSGRLAKHCAGLDQERLFTSATGRPVDRNRFGETCHAGAASAGLPDAWVAYQCRHAYASELISKRVPIDRVARMLGHASTAITYRTYSHLMPGELDDIRSVLDAA